MEFKKTNQGYFLRLIKGEGLKNLVEEYETAESADEAREAEAKKEAIEFNGERAEAGIEMCNARLESDGRGSYFSLTKNAAELVKMDQPGRFGVTNYSGRRPEVTRPAAFMGKCSSGATTPLEYLNDHDRITQMIDKKDPTIAGSERFDQLTPQDYAAQNGESYIEVYGPVNEEALAKFRKGKELKDAERSHLIFKVKDVPAETAFKLRHSPATAKENIDRSLTGFGQAALDSGDILIALGAYKRLGRLEDGNLVTAVKKRLEGLKKSDNPKDVAERTEILEFIRGL